MKFSRDAKIGLLTLLGIVGVLLFWGVVGWIALHFIIKFW